MFARSRSRSLRTRLASAAADGGPGFLELRLTEGQLPRVTEPERIPLALCNLGFRFLLSQTETSLRQLRPGSDHGLFVVERVDPEEHVTRFEETP